MINNLKLGFTLIELLVVISIIGILIAISGFGLQGARSAARDARRKSDIEQIRSALELFKADCGRYPTSAEFPSSNEPLRGTYPPTPPTACANANIYLAARPPDPLPGSMYRYVSPIPGRPVSYEICARLENGGGTESCGGFDQCGTGTCNYRVESP